MVLIISQHDDGSTINVVKWLLYYNIPYVRIDRESRLVLEKCELKDDGFFSVILRDITQNIIIDLDNIKAYWYRRGEFNFQKPNFDHISNDDLKNTLSKFLRHEIYKIEELIHFILSYKNHIGTFNTRDLNKLEVLMQAKAVGLKVPKSLVSRNKSDLNNNINYITKCISDPFHYEHGGAFFGVYTKSLDINIAPPTYYPTLFQEEIEKEADIRVFYLLGEFYSMAIMSQSNDQTKTDFRRYLVGKNRNRNFPFRLPEHIKLKLNKLMLDLKLQTGSIDLILEPNGEFVFLEINPIGQYDMVSGPCNYYLDKLFANRLKQLTV